jgi:hypothetical protein
MLKMISATEAIHYDFLRTLLYGDPGIGKTTLGFTVSRPFLLNFDKQGLGRASRRLDSAEPEFWEDVIALQSSPIWKDFDTLVIDTVGNMIDVYIKKYVQKQNPKYFGAGGEIQLKGYGYMRTIFENFNSWAYDQKLHIVYIAHATEERLAGGTRMVPDITGGSYDIIRRQIDLIGYYSSVNDKRVIDFTPRDNHLGKDCAKIGSVLVPSDDDPSFETFLGDIIDKTLSKMNELADNQKNIALKLFDFEAMLTGLTVEKCTTMGETISKETNRSIKKQMTDLLFKKAAEAKIEYDQKNKVFKNV